MKTTRRKPIAPSPNKVAIVAAMAAEFTRLYGLPCRCRPDGDGGWEAIVPLSLVSDLVASRLAKEADAAVMFPVILPISALAAAPAALGFYDTRPSAN